MFKFSGKQPANLGAKNGKLAPVVNKPNNVSSQADTNDRAHYVAPLSSPAMQRRRSRGWSSWCRRSRAPAW